MITMLGVKNSQLRLKFGPNIFLLVKKHDQIKKKKNECRKNNIIMMKPV